MSWHIFRKDLRLLWPMVALVAGVQWLNAALLISGGRFARSSIAESSQFGWVSNLVLPGVGLLGLAVLVMAAVQQDRLPGTTQDWLTRPIPRRQLLTAKLLFVVLNGVLPIFAADLAMGFTEHLNFADVVAASLTRSAVLFCLVCLPAALVGAVTRTLTEALVLVVAVGVLLIVEFITILQFHTMTPMTQSGFGWIATPTLAILNFGALLIFLPLQFRWRSSNRVRWILVAYFCLLPAVIFLPWGAAIQIHRAVDSGSFVSPVSIAFDTTRSITFIPAPSYPRKSGKPAFVTLRVPVVLSNLGQGNRLNIDRIKLRSLGREPRALEAESLNDDLMNVGQFGYVLDHSPDPGKPLVEIQMTLPFDAFEAARAAPAGIEMQLVATRLRQTAEKPLQSLAPGSIDDHGRCYRGDMVQFGKSSAAISCVSARPIGNCFGIRDASRQVRSTSMIACRSSSYAPWPLPLWRDAYYSASFGAGNFFAQGIRVDENPQTSKKPALIITNYVPDIHLIRTLGLPMSTAIEKPAVESRSTDGVGPAARFASPAGVVADRRGNLFIVDQLDSVIRKLTPAGEVSTFAGKAQQTGRNDGVSAEARFNGPRAIAIDSADNLFVADTGNGLIRKITPAGIVTTMMAVAGAGNRAEPLRFNSPRGVICAADGALYVIDSNAAAPNGNAVVRKISATGVVSNVAGPEAPVADQDGPGVVIAEPSEI